MKSALVTSHDKAAHVAKEEMRLELTFFLLFISKEQSSMAALWPKSAI